jgi:predicted Ser/Thr protein kinase
MYSPNALYASPVWRAQAHARHSKRERDILQAFVSKLLKKDAFGQVSLIHTKTGPLIRRDTRDAAIALRWIARRLLAREARALAVLEELDGIPALIRSDKSTLDRTYVDGVPMQEGRPGDIEYFHAAARILRRMHRLGVVHNDLAKEPNLLLTSDGRPAIVDFQLSWFVRRRGPLFRTLAREDIRHLLKHKRTYCPDRLTCREKSILANPSMISKLWMMTGKPVYIFITRKVLGWQDREGAGER